MDKLLTLIERGVITTRLITLTLTGICAFLWLKGLPLDETLKTSWLIIIGFWFNSELTQWLVKYIIQGKVKEE